MSRKASDIINGRRLRLMPLNILGGGPIIIDIDEEERKRQKRRLERAKALVEAEELKQAQEQALAQVQAQAQAQAQQAEEEEQKKQDKEKEEQSPSQAPVPEAAVPASPARSPATIRIRESKDELQGTRTIEFCIDDKNTQETPDSKKEDTGDGANTAEVDGVSKAATRRKKKSKKPAWVTYLDESGSSSSRDDAGVDADDDDTDVSTKADDGLEDHIRHLATRLCIGNDDDRPTKKATEKGASTSKHQGRRRRRSHGHKRHQMHFFSDVDKAKGTREVRLEAYSKKGDKAGEERRKRLLEEKRSEASVGETKLDETSPSKEDIPRFLPAPPSTQNGHQALAVNDPNDDHEAHHDRFLRSRARREHYLETLPPPPVRPAVDAYGHPVPSYAAPYAPYPAYPSAYAPLPLPPPPPMYPPYHAHPPYAAYGPPPPPPEHTPYYYDHHYRRASDHQYAPAPYAPYAPTPPSPRSPVRHISSGSVQSGPGGGRTHQRDGPGGHQQSRRHKGALPYGGGDKVAAWHDPDAAAQGAGGSDTAWNKAVDWDTTPGIANDKSKHTKGIKDQENNKSNNDLDDWGIRWDDGDKETNGDAGKHKNKGKDAEKTDQDNGNNGWVTWDTEEKKSSKDESGWPGWSADKTNNSNNSWAGWGTETKKGDANSHSGWTGWDTGSNGAKDKPQQGQTSNHGNNGNNDNFWGVGGDGVDDNGAGDYGGDYGGDYAGGGDSNDLWSGGNNMATMAEDDNDAGASTGNKASALPGAWPPSDGYDMQQAQQAGSSHGGNVAW